MKDIDKKIRYYFIETGQIPPITKAEFLIRANYLGYMSTYQITFKQRGITDYNNFQAKNILEAIYKFYEKHGVLEVLKIEIV